MNILVLGATGYTGSYLVKELLARKHTVRALTRELERAAPLENQGVEVRVGDVRDIESIRAIAQDIQVIFNLIGYCRIEPSESKTILQDGARNIAAVIDASTLQKYIWTSNVSVYGYPKPEDRLDESTPSDPKYSLGKQTVETERFVRDHFPGVSLRVANVYGPGRDYLASLREGRLRLLNGGENWQSRIHVEDLVRALLGAWEHGANGRAYIACDDLPTTVREFFIYLSRATGAPLPLNLEVNAARAYGVFGRAMNALAGQAQYQLSENVIGLLTGNYYCSNDRMRKELHVTLNYPTFREGYAAMGDLKQQG